MTKTDYKERFLELDGRFSTALTELLQIQLIGNKATQGHNANCYCALCLIVQRVNATLNVI